MDNNEAGGERPGGAERPAESGAAFARSVLLAVLLLADCAGGYQEPPPNSIVPSFDARGRAVQLAISGLGPASAAALVAPDGARFPAAGTVSRASLTTFALSSTSLQSKSSAMALLASLAAEGAVDSIRHG